MTIKQKQYCRDVPQQNKIVMFGRRKEKISEEMRQIERGRVRPRDETLLFEEKTAEEGNNQLLILANFAELMSESENSSPTLHQAPQNHEGLDSSVEAQHLQQNVNDVIMATDNGTSENSDNNSGKADEISLVSHETNERDGPHGEGTLIRLSHIRRQARLKSRSFMEQSIREDTYRPLRGSRTRLTQIRRQARCRNRLHVQDDTAGCSHGKLLGGTIRLSEIRRQARSKSNCSLQEGSGMHMQMQSDCKFHEVDADNVNMMAPEIGQLRLSQLRRKARLDNTDLVSQTNAGDTAEQKYE